MVFRWAGVLQTAEVCFCHGRLSAPCGSMVLLRVGFPHRAEAWFCCGRLSAECGSVVLLRATFRKARKHGFVAGGLSAPCGNVVLPRAVFRTMRKSGFAAGSVPQSADVWFCYGWRSDGRGVAGQARLFFTDATFPAEGVFKKQRCCFLTDSLLCKLSR